MENNIVNNGNGSPMSKKNYLVITVVGFIAAGIVAGLYIFLTQSEVYVEKSQITAPLVDLSSQNGGKLEKLYVNPGDSVSQNQVVAEIGQELVKTKDSGMVVDVKNDIGKTFMPGEAAVTIVKPEDLRVVAQVEEDKGLSEIKVGQRAFFTVDAYGSKKFDGIVDEVSPTSRQSDVVFNISSQRQMNEFNVKIRFDQNKYPELRNGMSAKSWIYMD